MFSHELKNGVAVGVKVSFYFLTFFNVVIESWVGRSYKGMEGMADEKKDKTNMLQSGVEGVHGNC